MCVSRPWETRCAPCVGATNGSCLARFSFSLYENRGRVLDALFQSLNQRGGIVAIDKAVIEGRGQIHHASNRDCPVNHHWTLYRSVESNNRHFRGINNRGRRNTPQLTQTRHRNRRSRQFLAGSSPIAGSLSHTANLRSQLPQTQGLSITDNRNLESLGSLSSNTHMNRSMSNDHAAFGIIQGIALGKVLQHTHQRADDKRKVGKRRGTGRELAVEMPTQRLEFRDVELLNVGEMRNVALRLAHALSNHTANADDFDFLSRRLIRRALLHR